MRKFVTDGYLLLQTDFSPEFHRSLVDQLNTVYAEEGNPGNNLLPRIRDLQKVFDHPVVSGALTSVLGPNYMLHAHRHGHYNASAKPGGWHKDSYWGYSRMRNHHPHWAMIMYFPQDTPVELGPTGIMPGTQNYQTRTFESDDAPGEVLASGKAGTFALIHYDIWHRSTPNVLGEPRYMLKFEFMRTTMPEAPSWNCQDQAWQRPAHLNLPIAEHEAMWEETWNWLTGKTGSLAGTASLDQDRIQQLSAALEDSFEPNAINAAYELASAGQPGVEALLHGLAHENQHVSRVSAYGLSAAGSDAVEGLVSALHQTNVETAVNAVFALGELRDVAADAVSDLIGLLAHPSERLRCAVVESLGLIGTPTGEIVSALIRCLQSPDVQVRFMTGLSLSKLGGVAHAAVPQLEAALDDDNRYVRAHAAEALHYIGTDEAKDVLIKYLLSSRWCPTTTKANSFYP
ncbi:phytanoyl-CoA dioxygenase [Paenibacillus xerothermodurans]|uniref:Phytanoyl-CoA dioxygenase n=2 Tax=Paenibacillus xerothermodurans TaxID=1977292 RepID=A0A2W1P5E1_PAEXE|nr:phytanoyl-CoA dioxygenase [Paenibacillus xerothermodurans]